MTPLFAQGDVLLEWICEPEPSKQAAARSPDGTVLVDGEATGHAHRIFGSFSLYRDDAIARDIPPGLYVGHLHVHAGAAVLKHEEHASIPLKPGTYRVRRQRALDPGEEGLANGSIVMGD